METEKTIATTDSNEEEVVEKNSEVDSSLAAEPNSDDKETEKTEKAEEASENSDKLVEDKTEKDPDVISDDEEIKNMGELRNVRKRNASLNARLKAKEAEFEEYKKTNSGSDSASTIQKIADLEAALKIFTDKEEEAGKKEALQAAGLPEGLLAALKGSEEEWKETLEILKSNAPTTKTRLKDDGFSNGLPGESKPTVTSGEDFREAFKNLKRRK
jgi:hypothetical protein